MLVVVLVLLVVVVFVVLGFVGMFDVGMLFGFKVVGIIGGVVLGMLIFSCFMYFVLVTVVGLIAFVMCYGGVKFVCWWLVIEGGCGEFELV